MTAKRHNVLHDINAIFKISIDEESSTMVFQAISRIYKKLAAACLIVFYLIIKVTYPLILIVVFAILTF